MPRPHAQSAPRADARERDPGDPDEHDLVPSRRQYLELKAQHPGAILLYRLGDFYETFDDDARVVARDARIVLTSRSFGRSGRAPMAGIPHHALNHYLGKLLAAGHTIAIAEQLSPPGRGLVTRGVTRVISPGTVADPALLPAGENRYLAAAHQLGERWGLAWVDVSTGEFAVTELDGAEGASRLAEEVARLNPAELLLPDEAPDPPKGQRPPGHVTRLESWRWAPGRASELLCAHFRVRSLAAFGCAEMPAAIGAAGAALGYLERTNPALLTLLSGLRVESPHRWAGLDASTRRNLELTRSLGTGGSRGSLLGVLDMTRTPMGARTLRRLVGQPLSDLAEINRRQRLVGALVASPPSRAALGEDLAAIGDLERLLGRIAGGGATARDFVALRAGLTVVPRVVTTLDAFAGPAPSTFDACGDVVALLERAVVETGGQAGIRPGFAPELDEAVAAVHGTREWLRALEGRERERTGIRSLKVGYNKVFGYYIEVTRPNLGQVPADYARKQTVANGERYITVPLKEAEARILAADEAIAALEREALTRLSGMVVAEAPRMIATARVLAELDALVALAEVAARNCWTAPVVDESDALEISGGRHPVVEAYLAGEPFIPNDCFLGGDGPRQAIVTGPNMGGKSTWLRQTAVIVLLAQIGSWVPAAHARVGVVDRIFSRVGAQDDLARGQSTFMTEMVETAAILRQATERSLVILDEVGRGTATADGLAIARAVLEDINRRIRARTLFATHYLELTGVVDDLPGVTNVHVAALEQAGRVVFLYAVRPGPADRSYGIHVARLAGLPPWVAARAERLLEDSPQLGLRQRDEPDVREKTRGVSLVAEDGSLWQAGIPGICPPSDAERLAAALRNLDLDGLTPRDALIWLWSEQERLAGERHDPEETSEAGDNR